MRVREGFGGKWGGFVCACVGVCVCVLLHIGMLEPLLMSTLCVLFC